ncbi:hemolysin family protein [Radiobacillus kanasensis]|uniref:hemolysin family protein n=1 Tax=Radiobacillus kanasensis TaxID=2844358 RepID=UPI001E380CD8|nr:hemolysin family protein [Radiobacillus kanasensis]UFU00427.1 hemolysin family protein [Radiobacillus kanasensis]
MDILNLFLLILLIALTGFFVATEFSIIRVRSSRIEQLITEGKKGANAAKVVVNHLDEYLSACQLGITVTALGLGWIGEPTVEALLHPLFEALHLNASITHILSFSIAFAAVTFLHVVVGELAPKTVAIQKSETVTLLFSKPIIIFYKVMFPFIWMLNGSAQLLVRLFGMKPASEHDVVHSEEELRYLLSESYKSGEINKNELKYVNNIFEFDERLAKEIMVPRTEIVTVSVTDSEQDILSIIHSEHYTRYPVVDGDKDHIIGLINIKEFLTRKMVHSEEFQLEKFIKPAIQVIETIPIHDLLVRMQKERTHMAILIDEYGGTSGIVTVEDILEEIVGEIRDEFDIDEIAEIRKLKDGHYLLDAKVLISQVNDLLGMDLAEDGVDTIGGWFMTQNMDVDANTEMEYEGYTFKVIEIDGHHILYLEVIHNERT